MSQEIETIRQDRRKVPDLWWRILWPGAETEIDSLPDITYFKNIHTIHCTMM